MLHRKYAPSRTVAYITYYSSGVATPYVFSTSLPDNKNAPAAPSGHLLYAHLQSLDAFPTDLPIQMCPTGDGRTPTDYIKALAPHTLFRHIAGPAVPSVNFEPSAAADGFTLPRDSPVRQPMGYR